MRKVLEHGKHNLEVHKYLKKNTPYDDWTVTTAFYAALHCLTACVFTQPIEIPRNSGHVFESFNQYLTMRSATSTAGVHPTPHRERIELFHQYLPQDIAQRYVRLHDASHTARYKRYSVGKIVCDMACQDIAIIAAHCGI